MTDASAGVCRLRAMLAVDLEMPFFDRESILEFRWLQRRYQGNAGWIRLAGGEREMVEATTGNARFFRRSGPYPLAVVAGTAGGIAEELELLLEGGAPLQTAAPHEG